MSFSEYNNTYLQLMPNDIQNTISYYIQEINKKDLLIELKLELSNKTLFFDDDCEYNDDYEYNTSLIPKYKLKVDHIIEKLKGYTYKKNRSKYIDKQLLWKTFQDFLRTNFFCYINGRRDYCKRALEITLHMRHHIKYINTYTLYCNICGKKFINCKCNSLDKQENRYITCDNFIKDKENQRYNYYNLFSCLTYQELIVFNKYITNKFSI